MELVDTSFYKEESKNVFSSTIFIWTKGNVSKDTHEMFIIGYFKMIGLWNWRL